MKKLLVLGDSFMHPDELFPEQHWSEMLPEYQVLMYSVSGSSNGIIAHQFYRGLEQQPDAVILGFTEPNRLEFKNHGQWVTGANWDLSTTEQKLVADMYKVHADHEMLMIKDCSTVRGLLSLLEFKKIPYAWTLNLLFNDISKSPFPKSWVNTILGDFRYRMTPTNLATYPHWKASPGFHTDDPVWQQRFANEARTLIQSVDFLSTNL